MKKKLAAIFLALSLLAGVPVFSGVAAPAHKIDCIDLEWARSAETHSAETHSATPQGGESDVLTMPASGSWEYKKICESTPLKYFQSQAAQSAAAVAAGDGSEAVYNAEGQTVGEDTVWDCGGYAGSAALGDVRSWATWPAEGLAENIAVRRFSSRFTLNSDQYYMLENALLAPEDELGNMSHLMPVSESIYVFVNGRLAYWGGGKSNITDSSAPPAGQNGRFGGGAGLPVRGGTGSILENVYPYSAGRCIDLESNREAVNIQPYLLLGENRIDVITAGQESGGMSKLKLYCGQWPDELEAKVPAYVVFAIDASAAAGTEGNSNFDTERQAINDYIDLLSKAPYANMEKHFALVSFGTGARVHISATDAAGKFSQMKSVSGSISADGPGAAKDNYIGSYMEGAGETDALADFNSIADKKSLFYSRREDIAGMLDLIGVGGNEGGTNAEAGILLAHDLLKAAPAAAKKMIVFIGASESTASSSFFSLYGKAGAGKKILDGTLTRDGTAVVVTCEGISEAVTAADFASIGKPETIEISTLSEAEAGMLKLRAMARNMDFYTLLNKDIEINPFAGERHDFDGTDADGNLRINPAPDFSKEDDINGYYWSRGLAAKESLHYYHSGSAHFRKNEGVWQFSENEGKAFADIYIDKIFAQSATAGSLGNLTFNNSDTELMIFASDEKVAGSRIVDYYGVAAKSAVYGSDTAKRFMIAAAARAKDDGIEIQAIGVGTRVLLPEYLHRTDSKGAAFIINSGTAQPASALTRKLFEFTNRVFGL